jgi:hypothetical protein
MYERECDRMRSGLARTVPKLRETHIIRDSWTKLNVAPAKIMQVGRIQIRELLNLMHLFLSARASAFGTTNVFTKCY